MCHYFFTIKKCKKDNCTICRPPRCSREIFDQLHLLLDSMPRNDLHYKSFEELYGSETTEQYRPSRHESKSNVKKYKKHTMPFCPSAFHAKNVEITVTCINCDKPRLLFSSRKLSDKDCKMLYQFLKMILYSCKTTFKNTSELTSATPSESLDEHGEGDDKNNDEGDDGDDSDDEYNDKGDNNFNNEYEHNVNLDENEDDQTDQDDVNHSNTESRDLTNNSTKNIKDSVQELFTRVFS
ncbi:5960_t:CDS:2 [Cetraspora pellucida]|uniref:5960_t:CDS:1 n=1 Tax=Cetraspora pellucida TaxID=1433469 RepID=A0ACA9LHP7_9GLOM|nr:5960_t:CDS:2 [Cetraspora pellucida]